jgi:carboxyl-terminal processing protease
MRMLRGAPGTTVSLLVIRGNAADPHEITLTREAPTVPAVSGRLINGDVGYIRVPTFDGDPAGAIAAEVSTLTKGGATRLIVDVRRTAEGPLQKGLDAASLFVPAGTTLAVRAARDQAKQPALSQAKGETITLPTLVLVNFGTSGPAELFSAALADNGRAKLVGERTNGRTGVQKLVSLPQGHALWLTYATYLSPKGEAIHEKGLKPAVTAEEEDVELGAPAAPNAKDPILDKALQSFGT